ncbi:peptidase family C54-domain-containing protein [Naematelia encephala]|uniref:Autophagy-related protein 4 n=1 Tax=Naematelia encephala TaxID=71784 RepID=A0A1Y2AMA3_9TREE|nr:peptidase family C54-domain-containing protein [Naematelia encephala]
MSLPSTMTTSSTSPQSPVLPLSSVPSRDSASSQPSSSSSRTPNLPPPPPSDRLPPPKFRPSQHPNHKFKLGRRNKSKSRSKEEDDTEELDDDEGWTLEGGRPVNGSGPTRESLEYPARSPETGIPLSDSQLTEVPLPKEQKKKSRGRGLVKKTSRMFTRGDKDKDKSGEAGSSSGAATPDSTASLYAPGASRQTSYSSYSSVTSSDSRSTTTSARRGSFNALSRPVPPHFNPQGHARRQSQDSQSSWQTQSQPRSIRSGSTSTHDSYIDSSQHPIPQRQGSHLSASVPGLSRNALPQPAPQNGSSIPGGSRTDTFPSRMSTWFSHLLPSASTTAVAENTTPTPTDSPTYAPPSPLRKPPSAAASFLNAARQKAVDGVRHLLDSEAQPDKCPDPIWVLGVAHPGWRPSTPTPASPDLPELIEGRHSSASSPKPSPPTKGDGGALRPSAWNKWKEPSATSPPSKGFGNMFSTSTLSLALPSSGSPGKETGREVVTESPGKARKKVEKEVIKWPDAFYDDFRSRVWCTYRSQYAPILSLPHSLLIPSPDTYFSAFDPPADLTSNLPQPTLGGSLPSRPSTSPWSWSRSEERGLTSDAGWGCMLRTGQSMLANALIHLHLGRDWRLPSAKPHMPPRTIDERAELNDYASYVRLMAWFMDDPSPLAPFSVHRMALIGKELGKEVGEWFGPSTAAGALKTLANAFPPCGLAVATATDSIIYKSDVYSASNLTLEGWSEVPQEKPRRSSSTRRAGKWGDKAVLVLVGLRLGLDGVNPMYYETIKALFTFPQSVGIAGGRPSSSYYFVASQANSLFYLDPHLTRPAVPLEIPPAPITREAAAPTNGQGGDLEEAVVVDEPAALDGRNSPVYVPYTLDVVNVDDISDSSESDSSLSPSKRLRLRRAQAAKRLSAPRAKSPPRRPIPDVDSPSTPRRPSVPGSAETVNSPSDPTPTAAQRSSSIDSSAPPIPVDPTTAWYANAYSEAQLRTFHCEKVKKMPLSGLDPSMLLGFLCKNERDFDDFCERVAKLPQKIFTIQEEPPSWDDDDDAGLESVSEPEVDLDLDESPAGSPEVQPDDDDDEENLISANTTLEALNIPPTPMSLSFQRTPVPTVELEEEEEWETGLDRGSTPSSQPLMVERGSTPSGQPVFVDRGSTPSGLPVLVDRGSQPVLVERLSNDGALDTVPDGGVKGDAASLVHRLKEVEVPTAAAEGRGIEQKRMESWVKPETEGEEAPNGDSVI